MSISFCCFFSSLHSIDAWHFWCWLLWNCWLLLFKSPWHNVYFTYSNDRLELLLLVVFFAFILFTPKCTMPIFLCINYSILLSIVFCWCVHLWTFFRRRHRRHRCRLHCTPQLISVRNQFRTMQINYTENGPRELCECFRAYFWVSLHISIGLSNQICTNEFNLLIHFVPASI